MGVHGSKWLRTAVLYLVNILCIYFLSFIGALIGIDYVWSLLEYKKFQTARQVYETVKQMRLQRSSMVQAKDQYVLVYKAVFQLVRQYLEEYQHDPSVAHMFDSTTAEKLSQISLPEYQNPSGLDEATNLEMEINDEELTVSGEFLSEKILSN